MSQPANSASTVMDLSDDLMEPSPLLDDADAVLSAESQRFADDAATRLMDELLGDVEQVLGGGPQLPTETVDAEEIPALSIQGLVLSAFGRSPAPTAEATVEPTVEPDKDDADLTALSTTSAPEPTVNSSGRAFDQLLMALAIAAVAVTGGLWWWMQHRATVTPAPAEVNATASGDREFLTYLQRSIEVLDQQSKLAQAGQNVDDLPNVSVASGALNTPATVLERVYIPVYQPPQGTATFASPPVASAPQPAPQQLPQQPIAATATIPNTASSTPSTAASPAQSPSQTAAVMPSPGPVVDHVLIGILELGDRSAALFEIDGVPLRIQLGENIASSGWSLVSVSNDEAVIRRNGEVRSIYLGQKF
ncbi:hypothetical protein ACQ4M4_15575 [Leptolyngbya sp. AN02str]|uniref:hypothetical protein n=1 Tax=Leptolyngbya sp. AN02str TaxID=3423363 RepID=UPI003D310825